jgi:glutamate-5-semialdehyde dehydrogenase
LDVLDAARRARSAARKMANVGGETKNKAILAIAEEMDNQRERIEEVNSKDIDEVSGKNLPTPLMKRLRLDDSKVDELTKGLRLLAELEDPVGKTLLSSQLDDGLELYKVTCPMGHRSGL